VEWVRKKKPDRTSWHNPPRVPVYRQEDYLRLLRKNYEEHGIEFDESKFRVNYDPPEIQKFHEPEKFSHTFGQLYLDLTYTKTKVKVKINCALYNIHENYYAVGKTPPAKVLVQALKTVGYSDEFLKSVIKGYDDNKKFSKKIWKYLDTKLFKEEKKKKKVKKIKKEPVEDEEDVVPGGEDDDVDSTVDDDEDPFDMEVEDDDELVQDEIEFSDIDDE
jgi:hypothetical protein